MKVIPECNKHTQLEYANKVGIHPASYYVKACVLTGTSQCPGALTEPGPGVPTKPPTKPPTEPPIKPPTKPPTITRGKF